MNVNIGKNFEAWGIGDDENLIYDIVGNHDTDQGYFALEELISILNKAYMQDELPIILREHSGILHGSILSFLSCVDEGAMEIVELVNREYS